MQTPAASVGVSDTQMDGSPIYMKLPLLGS